MNFEARAVAAIESAFDEAVKQRFIQWTANLSPGSSQDFVAALYKLNSAREGVLAELAKQAAKI
jgi:hypothetical protein